MVVVKYCISMHYLAESRSLAILAEIRGRQWAERVLAVRQGTLTSDPGHSSYDDSTWETMHWWLGRIRGASTHLTMIGVCPGWIHGVRVS